MEGEGEGGGGGGGGGCPSPLLMWEDVIPGSSCSDVVREGCRRLPPALLHREA